MGYIVCYNCLLYHKLNYLYNLLQFKVKNLQLYFKFTQKNKFNKKSLHIIEINSIITSIDCMYGVSIVKSVLIGVKNKINE